jgi:hypothetical protein
MIWFIFGLFFITLGYAFYQLMSVWADGLELNLDQLDLDEMFWNTQNNNEGGDDV